jgi:DNA-binding SARP family transcriptional activator/RNAse (barnase) inhibitor barstar
MTKVLKLAFLGRMRLNLDDTPLTELASGKAQALLCYLAVNGRSHSRLSLSNLLWDEMSEADARRNLRGVLLKLRQTIDPFLDVTHQTVGFDKSSSYWLDVTEFRQILADYQTKDWGLKTGETLQTAVSLYRGEFLEEFHVRQAPMFEEWVMQQRAELREMALGAYQGLADFYARQHEFEAGIDAARHLLRLDPMREAGHRQLMHLLALNGQRTAALTQFETCRQILADELDVIPDEETAVLAEQIRTGQLSRGEGVLTRSPAHPITPSPFIAGPPITHPAQFYGRQRELKRIFNLLGRLPLQNAAIIGERRSGKTSLLHYLKTITTTPTSQLRPDQRQEWLPRPERCRWIFVDFQDPRLGRQANLLRYLLAEMSLPDDGSGDLDAFLDVVADNLNTPTVILFDEIGVALERYPELDDAFWESLRSLATNQVGGNLGFVLAAHEAPSQLAQHSGLGSPFFNIFGYTAVLPPLTDSEARQLIAGSPIPFPEEDVDWLLAQSGGWPMPLQILCRERLLALEEGETGSEWQTEALRQMEPFRMLNGER